MIFEILLLIILLFDSYDRYEIYIIYILGNAILQLTLRNQIHSLNKGSTMKNNLSL